MPHGRRQGQRIQRKQTATAQLCAHAFAQRLVADHHVGGLQPSEIERFTRGRTNDGVLAQRSLKLAKSNEIESGHGEISVDLIGNDKYIVVGAYLREAVEFVISPHPPDWIVWTTQKCNLHGWVGGFSLQVVEVHFVTAVRQAQRVGYGNAAVGFRRIGKRVIDRSLNEDFVTGLGESANCEVEGRDNPGHGTTQSGSAYQSCRRCIQAQTDSKYSLVGAVYP